MCVGELSTHDIVVFIKKRDMKFVTAFHHAENWNFFPTWDKRKRQKEMVDKEREAKR